MFVLCLRVLKKNLQKKQCEAASALDSAQRHIYTMQHTYTYDDISS